MGNFIYKMDDTKLYECGNCGTEIYIANILINAHNADKFPCKNCHSFIDFKTDMIDREKKNEPCYYYLHSNGDIIFKSMAAIRDQPEEYFESDFVVAWWYIDSRSKYFRMVNELREMYYNGRKINQHWLDDNEKGLGIKSFMDELREI